MKTERPRGRPKGAKNKRTVEREAALKEMTATVEKAVEGAFEGDALAYLTSIYKDPAKPDNLRMDAAKMAIRYERPALAPIEQPPERDSIPLVERLQYYRRMDLIEANDAKWQRLKNASYGQALIGNVREDGSIGGDAQ